MYAVDNLDQVVEETGVPQCDSGAPYPLVVTSDYRLALAYYIFDPRRTPSEQQKTGGDPVAVVRFRRHHAVLFGGPNDEALSGHPLWDRGLRQYGAYQVRNSSWLRKCIQMNRVHPSHSDKLFEKYVHYVFTFHDGMFECISEGFDVETIYGRLRDAMPKMQTYVLDP